jgi:arylsulfatase
MITMGGRCYHSRLAHSGVKRSMTHPWPRRAPLRNAIAGLTLALAACAQPSPPSVVLITLDTTRADHLGAYGYEPALTSNLDRFAEQSVLYESAYATSSWTLPSHASLFTGLLPMQHGAQTAPEGSSQHLGYTVRPLADDFVTLAEHLRSAGYRTGAVVGGPALRRELGLSQGFEHYDDEFPNSQVIYNGRRAEVVANRAIAMAKSFGADPFFLFINFFDPHSPYRPPPPHDRGLPDVEEGPLFAALVERLRAHTAGAIPTPLGPVQRQALDALVAGYDAELAYLDQHFGRLLDALAALPQGARLLVAVTSDHGESFGEHDYFSHGAHLYEDNTRVPLMVRHPNGHGAGLRIRTPVQNHRIFATVLGAAGVPLPDTTGVRALPAQSDGEPHSPVVVTEVRRSDNNVSLFGEVFDRDLRSLYAHPYKLIRSTTGAVELFDLEHDRDETVDLSSADPAERSRLDARLSEIIATHPPRYDETLRAELEPDTEAALKALGYLD